MVSNRRRTIFERVRGVQDQGSGQGADRGGVPGGGQEYGREGGRESGRESGNGQGNGGKSGRRAGRTALVTGGSRGIGRGIALELARDGCDLCISHWRDEENARELAERIGKEWGRKCELVDVDLREAGAPEQLVGEALSRLGHIDAAINNAGVTIFGSVREMDPAHMETLYRLNFLAPLLVVRAASRHMIERGIEGNIVNIASTRAERAYPDDAVYGGLKAALKRATESMALELAPYRIRVNAVAPGAIETVAGREAHYRELGRKVPLERVGQPEDIGRAVRWLISPEASYMTGATMRLDGGLVLPGMPESGSGAGEFGWGRPKGRES